MAVSKIPMEFANGSDMQSGDANNLITTGVWSISSASVANTPTGYGLLAVYKTPMYVYQVYYRPDKIYVRRYSGSTWTEWKFIDLS